MPKKCIICYNKRASYNLPIESNAAYCKGCSTTEMIDIRSDKLYEDYDY